MGIAERLIFIREVYKKTQVAFAEFLGVNRTTLRGYESGSFSPNSEFLLTLKQKTSANIDWILSGEGESGLKDHVENLPGPIDSVPDAEKGKATENHAVVVQGDDLNEVPVLPTDELARLIILPYKVSAGTGQEKGQIEENVLIEVPRRILGKHNPKKVKMAEVTGDSMTGVQIFDGDMVFFVEASKPGDGIFVILVDGDLMIKRLFFDYVHQKLIIKSENERYPTIEVDWADQASASRVKIEGKVIGWLHRHPY